MTDTFLEAPKTIKLTNFVGDLAMGNKYEKIFMTYLSKTSKWMNQMQGKFSAYDICADGIYYEVKSDRKAHATNNICIEYECSQKPSGINVTQADFYVYFIINPDDSHHVYKIPVADIKKMIEDKKYSKDVKGGDGWRSAMYLFDISLFSEYCIDSIFF
jgi:hypothetical protein